MGVKPKMPDYSAAGPAAVHRTDAPARRRPRILRRWSKRQTLLFIIAFNVVGWTALYVLLKPH